MSFLDLSSFTGLVATIVLTFNFLLGMMISTTYKKHKYWKSLPQRIKQINVYNLHNWTAYFALLLVLLHPIFLLFDKTAKFKLTDIFFPINAPTQKVFVALGTLAMCALMIVIITTQKVIRDKMSFRTWKNIHLISYITAMLFVVHGIVMDPQLKNRPIDIFDAEKLVSEVCLIVLLVAGYLRYKFHTKTKTVL